MTADFSLRAWWGTGNLLVGGTNQRPHCQAYLLGSSRDNKTNPIISHNPSVQYIYAQRIVLNMPGYCYSPLLLAGDSIRLLRLKPAEDKSADIHCELFEYVLHDFSTVHLYEALSYVWGSSEKKRRVFMYSCSFDVTDNLYAALLELRHHTMERTMWVDAMCINQDNREEKEHQIRIMAKIYSQANLVIVWLGEAAEFSDQVLEQILAAGRDMSTHLSSNNAIQEQTMALLQRPWFRRIWVSEPILDRSCNGS
jgi:hypothetical protein